MTLKLRNRLLNYFFWASVASIAVSIVMFLIVAMKGFFLPPPTLRIPEFLSKTPLTPQSLSATIAGFIILFIYIPVIIFTVLRSFESSQSSEIIFFSAFILSCLCETARFYILILGIWQTFTNLLIFLGNILLFGRILSPLSFACASILSETTQRQDVERNYILLIIVSFIYAIIIPLNTAKITSTGFVTEGFMMLINISKIILILTALVSFFVRSYKHGTKDYIFLGISQLVLFFGYTLLTSADNWVFVIAGSGLLFSGSYQYLKSLHKMYMWS